jgi:hypothetical protein
MEPDEELASANFLLSVNQDYLDMSNTLALKTTLSYNFSPLISEFHRTSQFTNKHLSDHRGCMATQLAYWSMIKIGE